MQRRWLFWALGGAGLLGLIVVTVVLRAGIDSRTGYHAPIWDRDGTRVLYVERQTRGFSFGLGYEHFSPPAHAYVLSDRFSLRRLDPATGRVETLRDWPASPLEGRWLDTYRGRLYTLPRVRLRHGEAGSLEYAIRLTVPTRPRAEQYGVQARWNNKTRRLDERADWSTKFTTISGHLEDAVGPASELMAPPGPDYYPSAILARDLATGAVRTLLAGPDHDPADPDGLRARWIAEHSIATDVARLRTLRGDHAASLARHKARGLSEGEALLAVNRDMQRLGHYPKSPTLTARRVASSAAGTPLIDIPEGELASGVFPDIERALAAPGTAVDKSGRYTFHRDYQNSAKLNALMQTDMQRFWVRYRGEVFEMVIERP